MLITLTFAASCTKALEGTPTLEQRHTQEENLPRICFGRPVTKGMMDNADLLYEGNRLQVYDLLTGFSGTISGWNGLSPYIDEEVIYNNATVWKYDSEGVYPWTVTGTHRFFGWMTYDAKDNLEVTDLVTPSLSETTLTVPSITFTKASPQFDFIYSDVETRLAAEKDYSVVPLSFHHLFTALSLQVENTSNIKARLNGITIEGLKNQGSAIVQLADKSTVTYGTKSASGSFMPAMSTGVELEKNHRYDAITGTTDPTGRTFFMLWPQNVDEIAPSNAETNPARLADGCEYMATDSLVVIRYQIYDETSSSWLSEVTTRVKFPNVAWEAGKRNHFVLQFADKTIQLTCNVLPWDYNEYDVNYSEGSIVVPNGLKFDAASCTINDSAKTITVTGGRSPKGTFNIVAPIGGTWVVGMTGDTEYFTISPASGTINPGVEGGKVTLTITPNLTLPRPTDKSIKLKFSVMSGSREVDANSEINRDDWTIILPMN